MRGSYSTPHYGTYDFGSDAAPHRMVAPMAEVNLLHAGDDAAPSASAQQQQTPSEQLLPQVPGFAVAAVPQVESEAAVASVRAIEGSAFSTWRELWSLELEANCSALQTQVHALQSDFDEASVFIRGDLAWRQQLGRFHDKVNDVLYAQIEVLRGNLKQNADLLSLSVAESLGRKDVQTKLELSRQTTMYEGKLRRTRTSLKKEIDRFTHLEKCLRKEEAFQAKEMYDALVLQLTTEHEAKEAALHTLLNELRSSYSAMELSNTHLMESLKAARKDAERMKKILVKQTSNVAGSPQKSSVRSPTRSSGTAVGGAPGIQDVYVQSLKQALSTSTQTIEGLKKQVAELTTDKENYLRKVRLAEDATSKVNDELAKVTQLLSESHAALIANKKTTEQVESETAHWKDLFVELQFRTGSNVQEIEAAKKLADATRDHIATLEMQVKRLENVERQKWTNDAAFAAWLDQEPGQRDLQALEKMVESFINGSFGSPIRLENDAPDSMLLLPQPPVERERQELETKLRYEFEKRYGEALNLRLNHERKRVLARIEMLCAMQEQQCEAEATTRQQQKLRVGKPGKVSYRLVHKIVLDAYDHLGFSEWSATDLDLLHAEIESLQAQLAQQHMKLQRIERFAEAQGMALAKADLLQQEKEFLLAELTDKYRELRAAKDEDALGHQSRNNAVEPAAELVRFDEKPLTVYGHPQRLELKKVRARPVSASPCLILAEHADREEVGRHQSPFAAKQRSFSTAGLVSHARTKSRRGNVRQPQPSPTTMPPSSHGHTAKLFLYAPLGDNPDSVPQLNEPQQQVEHIRSILKTEPLQVSPAANQLEDGSHLGPDGVRFCVPCTMCRGIEMLIFSWPILNLSLCVLL